MNSCVLEESRVDVGILVTSLVGTISSQSFGDEVVFDI